MTPRENVMAVFNRQQPEYYGDFMPALDFVLDPVFMRDRIPQDGREHRDSWGTLFRFDPGSPGAHPVVNNSNAVIRDITKWKEQLNVPTLSDLDWSGAAEQAKRIDRSEKFCAIFSTRGLFERSHHLMGMEEALTNYLEYPEEMADILRIVADYKNESIKLAAKYIKPDAIVYHDDWGYKKNLFLPPRIWREIIKPLHTEIVKTAHECGMMFVHHADCICEPIVLDMVEMGIDVWQGVIPQNDIVKIQQVTEGKLAMNGGIDGPAIDIENITEEEIRAEVRRAIDTYCPAGRFYPSIPISRCFRKWNHDIYLDELNSYGREWARRNPIS
ncbi:MAG TPA: methyltransferase [Papillibacter sp.]|jgi:hypothetical protein|nr:methyltransferase [Papillibacter sp.]